MNIKTIKPKKMKHRGVRFHDAEWDALKIIADKEGVYVSDIIRHASKEFAAKYSETNPS